MVLECEAPLLGQTITMFVILGNHSMDAALLSWRYLNTCLLLGSPCSAVLVCMAFAFPIKLSLAQPRAFPAFTPMIPSLTPLVGRE